MCDGIVTHISVSYYPTLDTCHYMNALNNLHKFRGFHMKVDFALCL